MRLFVFDVDGTILPSDGILRKETIDALNGLLDNGDVIAIASGRPYLGIVQFLNKLHEGKKFCIGANGGELRNFEGEVIKLWPLEINDLNAFIKNHQEMFLNEDTNIYAYLTDGVACYKEDIFIEGEHKYNNNFPVFNIKKDNIPFDSKILKFQIGSSKELSLKYEKEITKEEKEKYQIVRSAPVFIEFINKDTDKAVAIKYLANYLNINDEDIYTFGDSGNDYLMIKSFNGVAMGNATKEVKEVAKIITKTVEENGVAYAIKNLIK